MLIYLCDFEEVPCTISPSFILRMRPASSRDEVCGVFEVLYVVSKVCGEKYFREWLPHEASSLSLSHTLTHSHTHSLTHSQINFNFIQDFQSSFSFLSSFVAHSPFSASFCFHSLCVYRLSQLIPFRSQ